MPGFTLWAIVSSANLWGELITFDCLILGWAIMSSRLVASAAFKVYRSRPLVNRIYLRLFARNVFSYYWRRTWKYSRRQLSIILLVPNMEMLYASLFEIVWGVTTGPIALQGPPKCFPFFGSLPFWRRTAWRSTAGLWRKWAELLEIGFWMEIRCHFKSSVPSTLNLFPVRCMPTQAFETWFVPSDWHPRLTFFFSSQRKTEGRNIEVHFYLSSVLLQETSIKNLWKLATTYLCNAILAKHCFLL